jgi:hypothetical protein
MTHCSNSNEATYRDAKTAALRAAGAEPASEAPADQDDPAAFQLGFEPYGAPNQVTRTTEDYLRERRRADG